MDGPGMWWRFVGTGVEFFDVSTSCSNNTNSDYSVFHYRTSPLADIDLYLQQMWGDCCTRHIDLPAIHVRHFSSDGSLHHLTNQSHSENAITTSQQALCLNQGMPPFLPNQAITSQPENAQTENATVT